MKHFKNFIYEGAWGYDPEQNDSALDYRGDLNLKILEIIYDEGYKKVHGGAFDSDEEVPNLDGNDAWDVISSIEYFFEKCTSLFDLSIKDKPEYEKYYYWWRLEEIKHKNIVELYSDALSKCANDQNFIDSWKEPNKMKKSLEKRANLLKKYSNLRDEYFQNNLKKDKQRIEATIQHIKKPENTMVAFGKKEGWTCLEIEDKDKE